MDFRTSVRALVEFVYRSGDYNRTGGASEDAMLMGMRIHKMIQSRQGMGYKSEVPLSFLHRGQDYNIIIEGRADGIEADGDSFLVDEIKGTYRDINSMKEPAEVHLAQAKCYAFMYRCQKGEEEIGAPIGEDPERIAVRLTYCNLDTEKIRYFTEYFSAAELEKFFEDTVSYYKKFMDVVYKNSLKAQSSIEVLEFPYSYRPGQRMLMSQVYSTLRSGKKLFLQAPTGTGKTLATVFPGLKAMGKGMFKRIFYLTARTTQGRMAADTLRLLREGGLEINSLELNSRDRICPMEKRTCDPELCQRAKGHFDRVNEVLYEILTQASAYTGDVISDYGDRGEVCPFELSLDLAAFSDFIICDYNYAFDPRAKLSRFFGEGAAGGRDGGNLFLVDEAHNLLERGRDMFSACISEAMLNSQRSIFKTRDKRISAGTGRVKKHLKSMEPEGEYRLVSISDSLINELQMIFDRLGSFFEKLSREKRLGHLLPGEGIADDERESALEFYFELAHFLDMYDTMDGDYSVYIRSNPREIRALVLYCVNPARNLGEAMKQAVSTILFSATLLPIQYYKALLGGAREDYEVYAASSFDPGRLGVYIGTDVDCRYKSRGEDTYRRIAGYISGAFGERPGKYMVFFPSYRFMEDVHEVYAAEYEGGNDRCLVQSPNMTDDQRREFLSEFISSSPGEPVGERLIGFCIMGSIFSEGIDLVGDALIGIIIVGTGTPMVCAEREILRDHFDREGQSGFDYAYKYPGMNKVLQAAGRLIRTSEDTGFVLLLDGRFRDRDYSAHFPREWQDIKTVTVDGVGEAIKAFWRRREEADTN